MQCRTRLFTYISIAAACRWKDNTQVIDAGYKKKELWCIYYGINMGQGLQKWEISSAQLVRLPSPGPVSGFLMSRAPEARKPIAFKLRLLDRARQETTFWKLKMVN